MTIELAPSFLKAYKKRIRYTIKLDRQYSKRVEMFRTNHSNPVIHDHALSGNKQGLRAFSVTGDVRVIYYLHNDTAYFIDIGSHAQVYSQLRQV